LAITDGADDPAADRRARAGASYYAMPAVARAGEPRYRPALTMLNGTLMTDDHAGSSRSVKICGVILCVD
jgi:hypothetical protein